LVPLSPERFEMEAPLAATSTRTTATPVVRLELRTRRRIAIELLPFLFVLYIVNYVDRTNLAYAALGMTRDLRFNDQELGLAAGIFFISYVALQIPGALIVEHWSARRMIAACMIAWGSLTALTALVHTPGQLYLLRFVVGAAEAGFFPGVIVYLSHWFIPGDRAKATSNFMSAIPLSAALGSPLAGWILGHNWLGVIGWRWVFIVEGLPAVLLGISAFYFLTDWPREATWLTGEERSSIEATLKEETPVRAKAISVRQALRSRTVLLLAGLTFFDYLVQYSFVFWFPTLLKRRSGFSDLGVGLVGVLPFMAAFVAMQLNGWHSDRTRERRWHSAIPMFTAAGGLLALLSEPQSLAIWVLLFTLVALSYSYLPPAWALPTEVLSRSAAATAVGMINAAGSVAGFVGPYIFGYVNTRTGSVAIALAIVTVAAVLGGSLALCIPRDTHFPTAPHKVP